MKGVRFDDVEVGDELPPLRFTLSNDQVAAYAEAAGVSDGRFSSDEAARAEGLPGQIVPGNMSLALFARLLEAWGAGVSIRRLSATFRGFVRPNVELFLTAVVTAKNASTDGGDVECDLLLENERGDRLVMGTAVVAIDRCGCVVREPRHGAES